MTVSAAKTTRCGGAGRRETRTIDGSQGGDAGRVGPATGVALWIDGKLRATSVTGKTAFSVWVSATDLPKPPSRGRMRLARR